MVEYKDQKASELHNQVQEEFKKIDKIGIRDDQEIQQAGINVINRTINKIKQDKRHNYGTWALKPLNNLRKELTDKYNELSKGIGIFTKNKQLINDLANKIDNAENETLKRLLLNSSNLVNRNAAQKSKEKYGENLFTAEKDGTLLFTKASNPIKIHDALAGLFDRNQHYQIDYSKCSNPRIKAKMEAFIGTGKCYISFDAKTKTYLIRNSKGQTHPEQRGFIWEGVRLIPEKTIQYQGKVKQEQLNRQL